MHSAYWPAGGESECVEAAANLICDLSKHFPDVYLLKW